MPPRLIRDVLLRDGSTLRLQAPSSDDVEAISAFYAGLSPDSRYMRFHGFGRTDAVAREEAEADGVDRVVLIGRHGDEVVAVASFDGLREPGAAEVSFAVADDFHGRGTATRMLEQLATIAAEREIYRFDAEVMADNQPMLNVFTDAGFGVQRKGAFGEVTVSLDIHPTEAVQERIDERDHLAAVASLRPILAPASVAVVGASSAPGSIGAAVLANLVDSGFRGVATPVNRSGGVVHSMRAARSLGELDPPAELVVIAVPGTEVLDVARQAAEHGAKAVVVLSTGFAEEGPEGFDREARLLEIVRSAGLRLVGPNCLGVLNTDPDVSLNATFAGARVPVGHLAISSQSGALGISLLGHAAARRLGVSSFASLGNGADVSANDLLELWEQDARTQAVMLYLETFGDPDHFGRIAQRVSRRKPILAVKGRRAADAVRSAAGSHTAAALRGDSVVDALLRPAGVLRFHSGDELFDAAEFFRGQPLPRGRRVGIVSNSTGMATLATDACGARGLTVAATEGALRNPLVVGIRAGPHDYASGVAALLSDAAVDAVMAYYVDLAAGDPRAILDAISDAAAGQPRPVVASVVAGDGDLPESGPGRVPNFLFPDSCADVLARAAERRAWLSRPLGQQRRYPNVDTDAARDLVSRRLEAHRGEGDGWLSPTEAKALIATHGISALPSHHCEDAERAAAVAQGLGGPVALNADFPAPAHAGDIDAVLIGLEGEAAVRAGWEELERRVGSAGRPWTGATVQPLMPPGADLLVGAVSDPDLGTVMALGLGGRQAGLASDVAFRLVPTTDVEARELIDASGIVATQLDGFRGGPVLDREGLEELVLRFALLLGAAPDIVEVDLNPVRCMTRGCVVLDMRLRVEHRRPTARVKTW